MDLDEWIERLEDLRDDFGGSVYVELANTGLTVSPSDVLPVRLPELDAEVIIQIG